MPNDDIPDEKTALKVLSSESESAERRQAAIGYLGLDYVRYVLSSYNWCVRRGVASALGEAHWNSFRDGDPPCLHVGGCFRCRRILLLRREAGCC
jgi:hypothetical protein